MNARQAKKRVVDVVLGNLIVDVQGNEDWLAEDVMGDVLATVDADRMKEAAKELIRDMGQRYRVDLSRWGFK